MDRAALIAVLDSKLPHELSVDLTDAFLALRRDVATETLERASGGKFVESIVQALQFLETGNYDAKPDVDAYLRGLDSRASVLDEGLRICAARIARSMYTMRNKRNILHKGAVDPNKYDLRFTLHGAQWILAELVRLFDQSTMTASGRLVDQIQAPIGGLVEDFGGRKIVLSEMPNAAAEILVLLHSHYPEAVSHSDIIASLDRRKPKTVENNLRALWNEKMIEGDRTTGYKLTTKGFKEAARIISSIIDAE